MSAISKLLVRTMPSPAPVHVVNTMRAALILLSAFCIKRGSSFKLPPRRASIVYFCKAWLTFELSVAARIICSSDTTWCTSFSATNRSNTLSTAVMARLNIAILKIVIHLNIPLWVDAVINIRDSEFSRRNLSKIWTTTVVFPVPSQMECSFVSLPHRLLVQTHLEVPISGLSGRRGQGRPHVFDCHSMKSGNGLTPDRRSRFLHR